MTLRLLESFDNFADDAWLAERFEGFNPATVTAVSGYHGGNGLASNAVSGTVATKVVPTAPEYTVGLRVRMTNTVDTGTGNMAVEMRLVADGDQFSFVAVETGAFSDEWRIEVRRGGLAGTLIATQTGAQHQGVWYYIEFQVLAHPSTGTYEVRVDGTNVLSGSGLDTTTAGNPNIDRVDIHIHQDQEIDDIYILDNAGIKNNDFLGPVYVEGHRPNNDGNQVDWTPSTGNNWSTVDEPGTGSLGTDYNETATATDVDLYQFTNLVRIGGASVDIPGVECVSLMALSAAGSEDFLHTMRSDTFEADKSAQSVTSTSQAAFSDMWETNEAETIDWTVSDIGNGEFGVEKA